MIGDEQRDLALRDRDGAQEGRIDLRRHRQCNLGRGGQLQPVVTAGL